MKLSRVGIDLAKNVYQLHGVDRSGKTMWRPFRSLEKPDGEGRGTANCGHRKLQLTLSNGVTDDSGTEYQVRCGLPCADQPIGTSS